MLGPGPEKAGLRMSARVGFINPNAMTDQLGRRARVMAPDRYRRLAWAVICVVAFMAVAETVCFLGISRHQAEQNGVRLVRFTQEAGRRQSPTSAVMIDLDNFELLNVNTYTRLATRSCAMSPTPSPAW